MVNFLINEALQVKMLTEKQRKPTLEEHFDYFVNHIQNDQLDLQTVDLEVFNIFKELIRNEYRALYEEKKRKDSDCSINIIVDQMVITIMIMMKTYLKKSFH